MEWEIGFNSLRLSSDKVRYSVEIHRAGGGITSYCLNDGAQVLCHMFNELCTLDSGGTIQIKKLQNPQKGGAVSAPRKEP